MGHLFAELTVYSSGVHYDITFGSYIQYWNCWQQTEDGGGSVKVFLFILSPKNSDQLPDNSSHLQENHAKRNHVSQTFGGACGSPSVQFWKSATESRFPGYVYDTPDLEVLKLK